MTRRPGPDARDVWVQHRAESARGSIQLCRLCKVALARFSDLRENTIPLLEEPFPEDAFVYRKFYCEFDSGLGQAFSVIHVQGSIDGLAPRMRCTPRIKWGRAPGLHPFPTERDIVRGSI